MGRKKKKNHRKFNVASHMGHISSILYSCCLCVCVNFKVRVLVHLKVCEAGDMCSHHKVCVYLCFIYRGGGGKENNGCLVRVECVCVCWGGI